MAKFTLKDASEYYLALSDQPKRFDANSPVTNVFFDDTNGEVFTVRSGGVTGVTVTGMDDAISTSFRMEDRGPIISIKFSPDHKILAIQRNTDNQNATVEFVNFKDLAPTNVEYSQSCKWKNAKILGFIWAKANEIAFITDYGIELLQVFPDKKQLKSLKSTSFSGAWYAWCAASSIVLLAGNNGALLQPFALNNSTVTKLQKLELDTAKPVVERDVFLIRVYEITWCAVFRHHGNSSTSTQGPNEVWMMPITGSHPTHILKTGLQGRFAVNVVDDLVVVHHQSSQTSQVFDIMDQCAGNNTQHNAMVHIPVVPPSPMRPSMVGDQPTPMYSVNWAVFQPHYIIDARLGTLCRVHFNPNSLAVQLPKDDISKIISVLLRRTDAKPTIYSILNQLVGEAETYLLEISKVFDEINYVYRQWADQEMAKMTAGGEPTITNKYPVLISQADCTGHVLTPHADDTHAVRVVTAYLASLSRHDMVVQHPVAELVVRTLVTRGACGRLRSLVRRGCLGDARPLACQLLSLGHIDPAAAQLALDMMYRLKGHEEIVEVLLSWDEVIAAIGAARRTPAWSLLPARKLLQAAKAHAGNNGPGAFVAVYHALQERNQRNRGAPGFLKSEQCDTYVEYYKQIMTE